MHLDTWSRLEAQFSQWPSSRASEKPADAEIWAAERQLGIPFPLDYQDFLRRYGAASVGPFSIYGLRPVEVMGNDEWSVLEMTRHFRSQRVPGCEEWVIFSVDHCANPIGFDRDGVVWIHDHDFGGIARLADNFEDYIRRWCLKLPKDSAS